MRNDKLTELVWAGKYDKGRAGGESTCRKAKCSFPDRGNRTHHYNTLSELLQTVNKP